MTEAERRAGVPRTRLAALRVAELRDLAASLGIAVPATLRKGPLVAAITEHYDTADSSAGDLREAAPDSAAPDTDGEAQEPETVTASESAVDEAQGGVEDERAAPVESAEAETASEAPAIAEVAAQQGGEAETAASPTLVEPVEPVAAEAPGLEAPEESVTSSESAVDEAQGGAEAPDEVAESTGTAQPRSAASHVNSGLTGIAEDLQELQRTGAEGETPADGQPEGERTGGRRGRGRGRGRGGQSQQQGQQQGEQGGQNQDRAAQNGQQQAPGQGDQQQGEQSPQVEQQEQGGRQGRQAADRQGADRQQEQGGQQGQQQRSDQGQQQDGEGRRGRYRDRKRRGATGNEWDEPEIRDDDVLIPIAGILDVLDNYAFVRTSGYLAGPNDVYVSLGQVRKYHLRRGDAVVGAIRQVPEGDQPNRQKYNALVKVDSINGLPVADAEGRVEFENLTPLYPQERLRLETEPQKLTARVIDLVSPIGKGQRGLVVGPPRSGRTLLLQAVANAVTTNNPEAHLMVVLVDERPEEVTVMQRTVKGEVIASTFDRPAEDHTTVAELAVDRAKRLVELGYDVVVLVDSITRLARAYDQVVAPSGRTVGGGLEAAALLHAKQFFGAARNIENGGSLTILATALTDSGARADEVILQEFRGTANLELHLSGQLAEKRIFPAIDVTASGTRREEMLMGPDEVKVTWQLRRALASHDVQEALDVVLSQLRDSASNVEFLVQMQKSLQSGK